MLTGEFFTNMSELMTTEYMTLEMLPARHGDCLWLEYGKDSKPSRILIDGGPVDTFARLEERIKQVPNGQRVFELVMLSHVDADHIEGLVRFFAEKPLQMTVREVWFNGWRQMKKEHGLLGAVQGEFLSALLVKRAPYAWEQNSPPWVVPASGALPTKVLEGGLKLTLLSPNTKKLDAMAKTWEKSVIKNGFRPGDLDAAWGKLASRKKLLPAEGLLGAAPVLDELLNSQFLQDQARPNGSSIAVLAEYGEKSVLLLADAHPGVVVESLNRLCAERDIRRLKVDGVKVSHHGSKGNTNVELLKLVDSPRWLISTNGDQFKHPDKECIARILKYAKPRELCFNYRTEFTEPWLSQEAQQKYCYEARVREDNELSAMLTI